MFSFWETPRSDTLLCVLMRMWLYVCVCKEEIVRPLPPGTIDQLQAVMNARCYIDALQMHFE